MSSSSRGRRGVTTRVPRLFVLTDRRQSREAGRSLVDTVTAAVRAGAPAVVLREKDLPADERCRLAGAVAAVTSAGGARLLVAGDAELADVVGAGGLHLAGADRFPSSPPGDATFLIGRSCHDAREVTTATAEGVDYLTVSPVAATASKPGYGPALGPEGLGELVAVAGDVAVLALGGVTPANAAAFRSVGAHGVAVMGAVMRAADPAGVVTELLHVLDQEDPR